MKLINLYNDQRNIYKFIRNEKGELKIETDNSFFPYYYTQDPNGEFKSFDGKSLRKVFVSNPGDIRKRRLDTDYEADLLFTKRYMIDKVDKLEKCPIKIAWSDIETQAHEMPSAQKAKYPVTCIRVGNSFTNKINTI